jgi:hypothetical protein
MAGAKTQLYYIDKRSGYGQEVAHANQAHALIHYHGNAVGAWLLGAVWYVVQLKIHLVFFS